MSELKNCPFCGSEDTARLLYNDRADVERCRNCNLSIVVPFGFTMWNNRPIEDALHTRIAELEAENDELSPYRDGYDFEKVKPPVGEIVLVQDCDRNFFSARKPHADCSFYESWNAEKYEWQYVNGDEDWVRWYPEPPEVTE